MWGCVLVKPQQKIPRDNRQLSEVVIVSLVVSNANSLCLVIEDRTSGNFSCDAIVRFSTTRIAKSLYGYLARPHTPRSKISLDFAGLNRIRWLCQTA